MTTTTTNSPGGLWTSLDRAVGSPTLGTGDVWRGLERRQIVGAPAASTGLWANLAERADPATYRPQAVPDVAEEQVSEGDQPLTVLRSPRGTYLRLTPAQRELWHQMDGTRTVAQLATQGFLKFKQLLPVGELVAALKAEGFLTEQPVGVYHHLSEHMQAQTPEGWGRRTLRLLSSLTWRFGNIDGFYGALYRAGGRLLFTPAFLALWALVALGGLAAFVLVLLRPSVGSGAEIGSLPLQIAALWLTLGLSFFLHESAHALAVKHYRRTLRGGGAMLYFGAPAFFVDTTDIWRSPRRARVFVSAAGPMSDLFIGALAAILVLFQPDTPLATVAYKLAFTCYIATLFNLNPLLELDGYYMLVDWLRLPDLRRRALAFVRGPLWQKLLQRPAAGSEASGSAGLFSRDERIFTLYGALALLYGAVALVFALQFWRKWLWGTIQNLWGRGELLAQVAAVVLFLVVVLPVIAGVALAAWGLVRSTVEWLIRRGYGRNPALLAAIGGGLVLALALLIGRYSASALIQALPVGLWLVATSGLLAVRPDYRGSAIATALDALLPATVLAGAAALARVLMPQTWLWQAADGLALLFVLLAGLAALLDVNLRASPPREQLVTALMLIGSFAVGGLVVAQQLTQNLAVSAASQISPTVAALLAAGPAYFGALALSLLLPYLFSLHDSRLIWSWGLIGLAMLAQTAAYVVDLRGTSLGLDVLASGLWAAAWLAHLATIRQITTDELRWPHEASLSEQERLTRAFQWTYAGCYRLLRDVYGARRTRDLDDRMDVLAATANWDVTLDRDRARVGASLLNSPLDAQGVRYAEVLRYTVATIEDIAGAAFARRTIRSAYDALPWPERETASRLCFPDTPWARELSDTFGDTHSARLRLLRQVDFLIACDDDELAALAHSIEERTLGAGELALRAGDATGGIWIVEAGEVLVTDERHSVDELHRGDAFGVRELLANEPATHTYRATVRSELLFIPAADYMALAQDAAPHAAAALEAAETLRLLERVPLFENMPRNTLRGLGHIAEKRRFSPRDVIVRQGQPSGVFYIIVRGRAGVLTRTTGQTGKLGEEAAKPAVKLVAQLGPEEFFGELELLRGTPPFASVLALTPLEVLALPHAAVQALLMGEGRAARGLEQIGTGRLIALRQAGATSPAPHA